MTDPAPADPAPADPSDEPARGAPPREPPSVSPPKKPAGRLRRALLGLGLLAIAFGVYARAIEPAWLDVTEGDVPAGLRSPLRVCHVTDLHMDSIGGLEERVLARIAQKQPDVVFVTGDNVGPDARYDVAAEFLSRIEAPLGVWVVRGNWEHWFPSDRERELYEAVGARLLVNESARLREDVWLIGLDDAMAGRPDADAAFAGVPRDVHRIALIHSPSYFAQIADRCNLVFAGHTHGGQVRIPFVDPWLPAASRPYVAGWYEKDGARLYVSRGIGTSIAPVRFRCRPELAFFTIRPQSE